MKIQSDPESVARIAAETAKRLERRLRVASKMLDMGFPDVRNGHLQLSKQIDLLSSHLEKQFDRTVQDIEAVFGDIELDVLCRNSFSEAFSDNETECVVSFEFRDVE